MRLSRLGLVMLAASATLQACDCAVSPPASSPGATAAPVVPSTPTTAPAPQRNAPPLDPARRRELVQLVRRGRSAARAERWDEALVQFERALAIAPLAPRVLCEAGFVAHRAGKETMAARRIELGISLFPDAEAAPDELRAPIAMCLYNRGLVAETTGQIELARDSYRRSLSLRPNATVERRLASLVTPARNDDTRDTLDGVPLDRRTEPPTVRANDEVTLVRAVSRGFAGLNEFSPEQGWSRAGVERIRVAPLTWRDQAVSEVVLLSADDASVPLAEVSLVLAFRTAEGYRVTSTSYGSYDNTDHGVWSGDRSTILDIEVGTVLRVDFELCGESGSQTEEAHPDHPDWFCYLDQTYGSSCTRHTVLCAPSGDEIRCADFATATRATEPARKTWLCTDEDGEELPVPEEIAALDTAHDYELAVVVSGNRVTVSRASGEVPEYTAPLVGAHEIIELIDRERMVTEFSGDAALARELAELRDEVGGSTVVE